MAELAEIGNQIASAAVWVVAYVGSDNSIMPLGTEIGHVASFVC